MPKEMKINTPCPECGRHEDGEWFTPCPSDDCPSNETPPKHMAGFTPGPWRVVENGSTRDIRSCEGAPRTVAALYRPFPYLMDEAENDANARLIAAAPALVEALRGLLQIVHDCKPDMESNAWTENHVAAYDAARAALKLAGL